MKVTRYTQSCMLIEKNNHRLVIDPGALFAFKHEASELGQVEVVLYTHQHSDHFDPLLLSKFQSLDAAIIGPADLAAAFPAVRPIQPGDTVELAGFRIKAYDLPHCSLGSATRPSNLGYVIDESLLHPGDSSASAGIKVTVLAVPILGPDISPKDAIDQIFATGAEVSIPIHYDMFEANPATFESFCKFMGAEAAVIKSLRDGESFAV